MSLILSGTNGLSDVDGSAATPAIRGTDTNTGIFFPAADTIAFAEGGAEVARLDSSGNFIVGATATSASAKTYISASSGSSDFSNNATLFLNSGSEGTTANLIRFNGAVAKGLVFGRAINADNFVWGFTNTTTPVMTLDSSGNLLVGTTSAGGRLAVTAGSASQSPIVTSSVSGDTAFQAILVSKFDNNSTTSQNFIQFQINNGGANCGKITANGANTAAFGSTSDQRVKENIVDLPSQLANIMALRPVEYDYIESYGGGHQIGFIAQEMQQVYPDVISEDDSEEKILSITGWSKTEARLVKAIQEQQALIAQLQADVAALKGTQP